jgi:hypothetical protein
MKLIIFTTILIFVFCYMTFAQTELSPIPIYDPDTFSKMSWKDERVKLNNFAERLIKEKDSIGFITLKIDRKTSLDQLKKRLKRIINYLAATHRIERRRIRVALQDFFEVQTMYGIFPKSEFPDCENCLIIYAGDRFKETADFFNQNKNL